MVLALFAAMKAALLDRQRAMFGTRTYPLQPAWWCNAPISKCPQSDRHVEITARSKIPERGFFPRQFRDSHPVRAERTPQPSDRTARI